MSQLLFPTWCPSCGRIGVSLCGKCAAELNHWFRAEADSEALPPGLPVWASGAYVGGVRKIIMAWKSGRRPDLKPIIGRLGFKLGQTWVSFATSTNPTVVVPAPSGWRRTWSGNEVVAPLAQQVAQGIRSQGVQAQMVRLLRRSGGSNHHLNRDQRLQERQQAIGLRPRVCRQHQLISGSQVIVVDDVLTTGATLAASAGAAGTWAPVVGAIVLCATPKPVYQSQ